MDLNQISQKVVLSLLETKKSRRMEETVSALRRESKITESQASDLDSWTTRASTIEKLLSLQVIAAEEAAALNQKELEFNVVLDFLVSRQILTPKVATLQRERLRCDSVLDRLLIDQDVEPKQAVQLRNEVFQGGASVDQAVNNSSRALERPPTNAQNGCTAENLRDDFNAQKLSPKLGIRACSERVSERSALSFITELYREKRITEEDARFLTSPLVRERRVEEMLGAQALRPSEADQLIVQPGNFVDYLVFRRHVDVEMAHRLRTASHEGCIFDVLLYQGSVPVEKAQKCRQSSQVCSKRKELKILDLLYQNKIRTRDAELLRNTKENEDVLADLVLERTITPEDANELRAQGDFLSVVDELLKLQILSAPTATRLRREIRRDLLIDRILWINGQTRRGSLQIRPETVAFLRNRWPPQTLIEKLLVNGQLSWDLAQELLYPRGEKTLLQVLSAEASVSQSCLAELVHSSSQDLLVNKMLFEKRLSLQQARILKQGFGLSGAGAGTIFSAEAEGIIAEGLMTGSILVVEAQKLRGVDADSVNALLNHLLLEGWQPEETVKARLQSAIDNIVDRLVAEGCSNDTNNRGVFGDQLLPRLRFRDNLRGLYRYLDELLVSLDGQTELKKLLNSLRLTNVNSGPSILKIDKFVCAGHFPQKHIDALRTFLQYPFEELVDGMLKSGLLSARIAADLRDLAMREMILDSLVFAQVLLPEQAENFRKLSYNSPHAPLTDKLIAATSECSSKQLNFCSTRDKLLRQALFRYPDNPDTDPNNLLDLLPRPEHVESQIDDLLFQKIITAETAWELRCGTPTRVFSTVDECLARCKGAQFSARNPLTPLLQLRHLSRLRVLSSPCANLALVIDQLTEERFISAKENTDLRHFDMQNRLVSALIGKGIFTSRELENMNGNFAKSAADARLNELLRSGNISAEQARCLRGIVHKQKVIQKLLVEKRGKPENKSAGGSGAHSKEAGITAEDAAVLRNEYHGSNLKFANLLDMLVYSRKIGIREATELRATERMNSLLARLLARGELTMVDCYNLRQSVDVRVFGAHGSQQFLKNPAEVTSTSIQFSAEDKRVSNVQKTKCNLSVLLGNSFVIEALCARESRTALIDDWVVGGVPLGTTKRGSRTLRLTFEDAFFLRNLADTDFILDWLTLQGRHSPETVAELRNSVGVGSLRHHAIHKGSCGGELSTFEATLLRSGGAGHHLTAILDELTLKNLASYTHTSDIGERVIRDSVVDYCLSEHKIGVDQAADYRQNEGNQRIFLDQLYLEGRVDTELLENYDAGDIDDRDLLVDRLIGGRRISLTEAAFLRGRCNCERVLDELVLEHKISAAAATGLRERALLNGVIGRIMDVTPFRLSDDEPANHASVGQTTLLLVQNLRLVVELGTKIVDEIAESVPLTEVGSLAKLEALGHIDRDGLADELLLTGRLNETQASVLRDSSLNHVLDNLLVAQGKIAPARASELRNQIALAGLVDRLLAEGGMEVQEAAEIRDKGSVNNDEHALSELLERGLTTLEIAQMTLEKEREPSLGRFGSTCSPELDFLLSKGHLTVAERAKLRRPLHLRHPVVESLLSQKSPQSAEKLCYDATILDDSEHEERSLLIDSLLESGTLTREDAKALRGRGGNGSESFGTPLDKVLDELVYEGQVKPGDASLIRHRQRRDAILDHLLSICLISPPEATTLRKMCGGGGGNWNFLIDRSLIEHTVSAMEAEELRRDYQCGDSVLEILVARGVVPWEETSSFVEGIFAGSTAGSQLQLLLDQLLFCNKISPGYAVRFRTELAYVEVVDQLLGAKELMPFQVDELRGADGFYLQAQINVLAQTSISSLTDVKGGLKNSHRHALVDSLLCQKIISAADVEHYNLRSPPPLDSVLDKLICCGTKLLKPNFASDLRARFSLDMVIDRGLFERRLDVRAAASLRGGWSTLKCPIVRDSGGQEMGGGNQSGEGAVKQNHLLRGAMELCEGKDKTVRPYRAFRTVAPVYSNPRLAENMDVREAITDVCEMLWTRRPADRGTPKAKSVLAELLANRVLTTSDTQELMEKGDIGRTAMIDSWLIQGKISVGIAATLRNCRGGANDILDTLFCWEVIRKEEASGLREKACVNEILDKLLSHSLEVVSLGDFQLEAGD